MYEQDIKRLTEEQPLIKGEIELLEQQIAQSVQKEYDSKQKLQELEVVNSSAGSRIKELEVKCSRTETAAAIASQSTYGFEGRARTNYRTSVRR